MQKSLPVLLLVIWSSTVLSQSFFSSKTTVENSKKTVQRLERLERQMSLVSKMSLEVQALRQENRQLRGDIELQTHDIEALKRKLKDQYFDFDQRISEIGSTPKTDNAIASTPKLDEIPISKEQPLTIVPVKPEKSNPSEEKTVYSKAYDLLKPNQGKYEEAIVAFEKFLSKYPKSRYAPNAQYWMAEANYVREQYDAASKAFKKVIELYPRSNKVPGALLKLGYISDAQGNAVTAKKYLNRVISEFPSSPVVPMAKQRIKKIKK